jgi:hypothetical protein
MNDASLFAGAIAGLRYYRKGANKMHRSVVLPFPGLS